MTVAIVGVGEVDPVWKDDRPVLGLVVDAIRRALDDAGLDGADVDGFASEARDHARSRPARTRSASPSVPATGGSAPTRRSPGPACIGAIQLAELAIDAGLADVVVSYYGHQPQHARSAAVRHPRRGPGQGRPRDAVRLLRPARLLRHAGPALPPRVRAHRRAARRRADRRAGVRPADARTRSSRSRSTSTATSPTGSSPTRCAVSTAA